MSLSPTRISLRRSALVLAGLLFSAAVMAQTGSAPAATRPAASAPAPAAAGRSQNATPEQLFADWDKDKNKLLSFDEFREGLEEARFTEMLARLEIQFRSADVNRTGALEVSEYANLPIIKRAGAGAPPMSAFDTNKNQSIDFKEFLIMVRAMMKRNEAQAR